MHCVYTEFIGWSTEFIEGMEIMSKIQGYVRAKRYTRAPGVGTPDVIVGLRDTDGELRLAFTRPNAPARKYWRSPSPAAIRKARQSAGLTQKAAAEKCLSALRSWQDWEYGKRRMHPAIWQVFLHATAPGQAAACELAGTKRSKSSVRQGRASRAHQIARA